MKFKSNPIIYKEVHIGMCVQDRDKDYGIIKKCDDIHNITVEFKCCAGGYGFYCLDPSCKEYQPLFEKTRKKIYEEESKTIICNCGETIWMFKYTMLCSKCLDVIQKLL